MKTKGLWANASEIKAISIPKSSEGKARLHKINEFTIFTSKTTLLFLTILSILILSSVILFHTTGNCTLESGMLRNFINGGYL